MRTYISILIFAFVLVTGCTKKDEYDHAIDEVSAKLRDDPKNCVLRADLAALYQKKGWDSEAKQQSDSYMACMAEKKPKK